MTESKEAARKRRQRRSSEAYRAADRALRAKHLTEWKALLAEEYRKRGIRRADEAKAERDREKVRRALADLREKHPDLVREELTKETTA